MRGLRGKFAEIAVDVGRMRQHVRRAGDVAGHGAGTLDDRGR